MTRRPRPVRPLLVQLLLAAVIAVGGWVRLSNLGAGDLTLEELNHYYVGAALARGEPPRLPSGSWYTRGVAYSRMTALAGRWVDRPEVAVRLPSALLGTLTLVVIAAGTYAIAGPAAAVGATLLFAVYPQAVVQSRIGRFYMLQLLPGVVALFAGWAAVRLRAGAMTARDRYAAWAGGAVATAALLAAAAVQVTTLPTLLAWWLCLAAAGTRDLTLEGRRAWRVSPALQLAVLIALAGIAALAVDPRLGVELATRAWSTPYWARVAEASPLFYYDAITVLLPALPLVGGIAFLYLLVRQPQLGGYLLTLFIVPAVLFSVVLPFKAERFLLLAVPPAFVAIGAAAVAGAAELRAFATGALAGNGRGSPLRRRLAVLLAGTIGWLPAMLAAPALISAAWIGYDRTPTPSWRRAVAIVGSDAAIARLPFGVTRSLPAYFYGGRVDFSVTLGHLERWDASAVKGDASEPAGAYVTSPPGTPDIYVGVPVLPTPESIRQRYAAAGAAVIAIDDASTRGGMVDSALLRVLAREGEERCRLRCGTLRLYVWRFANQATTLATDSRVVAGGAATGAAPEAGGRSPTLAAVEPRGAARPAGVREPAPARSRDR